jgi:nucleoside-specific outer membrane channel protein Tsx
MRRASFLALPALILSTAVHADFTAANVQYMIGPDLEVEDSDPVQTMTFEVANGWKYGDNFFFTDVVNGAVFDTSAGKAIQTYGEWHSRFSFSKITGKDISAGIFGDVLLAGEVDYPAGWYPTYLYGLGTDWKIPGAAFFMVNFFIRDEAKTEGISFQVNPAWLFPFTFGPVKGSFGGWADFMTGEGDDPVFWWQMQPTLMLDVGNFAGAPGKIEAGVEYEYFQNFLGIEDLTINKPQFVLKWNL